MTFKPDIVRKTQTDFADKSSEVFETFKDAIENTENLKTDRVIRCIIFLSKGNIDELNRLIKVAINDTRDVMLWAEYENLNSNFNYKRIRDFNKTFEESTNNVNK
jgi:hypothetical protein